MKKLGIILCLVLLFFLGYNYLYHGHRDIKNEEASFSLTVLDLLTDFEKNELQANTKYLDKSILLKGKVTSVDALNNAIVLNEKVFVILGKSTEVKIGTEINLQGRVIGFDNLLGEIKIDQAIVK